MAEHAEGTTEVFATAAEVMAVVADFEAYPEWVGALEEVEVLARDRRGRGTRVAFRLGTPVGDQAYTLAYRYEPRDAGMSWTYVEGTLDDLAGSYALEPGAETSFPVASKKVRECVVIAPVLSNLAVDRASPLVPDARGVSVRTLR